MYKYVIHTNTTANILKMSHPILTLNALYINPSGANLFFSTIEHNTDKMPDSVIIITIIKGIAPPIVSFKSPAKNATGKVVCFSPSSVTLIGIKNKIMPIKDMIINLSRPRTIWALLY